MAAAASTWTNIATKLSSCAGDLEAVCTGRLAGQESVAVATFKSLQAGSAEHLRMTGDVAGAILGGLTVASVIVRVVHDLLRDAICDIIGKIASKITIGVLTRGPGGPLGSVLSRRRRHILDHPPDQGHH